MTIKYVLRDVESGEYFTCYPDEYEIDDVEYLEWVIYTSDINSCTEYDTLTSAEYYKKLIYEEMDYVAEIVRIGE